MQRINLALPGGNSAQHLWGRAAGPRDSGRNEPPPGGARPRRWQHAPPAAPLLLPAGPGDDPAAAAATGRRCRRREQRGARPPPGATRCCRARRGPPAAGLGRVTGRTGNGFGAPGPSDRRRPGGAPASPRALTSEKQLLHAGLPRKKSRIRPSRGSTPAAPGPARPPGGAGLARSLARCPPRGAEGGEPPPVLPLAPPRVSSHRCLLPSSLGGAAFPTQTCCRAAPGLAALPARPLRSSQPALPSPSSSSSSSPPAYPGSALPAAAQVSYIANKPERRKSEAAAGGEESGGDGLRA